MKTIKILKEEMKFNEFMDIIVTIFWSFGNVAIFSGMIYLSYSIHKEINSDVLALVFIMMFWLIGQLRQFPEDKRRRKK